MTDTKAAGAIDQPRLIKAGCGFRYDPEALSPETGFDFSGARELLQALEQPSATDEEPQSAS